MSSEVETSLISILSDVPVNRITKHESRMTKEIRVNKIVGRLCQTPWDFFVIWSLFRHSAFLFVPIGVHSWLMISRGKGFGLD